MLVQDTADGFVAAGQMLLTFEAFGTLKGDRFRSWTIFSAKTAEVLCGQFKGIRGSSFRPASRS